LNRADFIGQFGIGLLSCFVVSDEIFMVTRSAREGSPAVEWRGRADGTYDVSVDHDSEIAPGTTVYLSCKDGAEEWFEPSTVQDLARRFGALLPFPIDVVAGVDTVRINEEPPWRKSFGNLREERDALMRFGRRLFDEEFFDVIPLRSDVGDVDGAAYILSYSPSPTAKGRHRVYLKNMLLSEASENLLPNWAFFVTCVVNTNELRPTASRESFYEDEMLAQTRDALGNALRDYLIDLKSQDPVRLQNLVALHFRAIKALASYDDEFFQIFVDLLPFETSLGRMTLGDFRAEHEVIRYVPNIDTFRQIAQVASSQGLGIINAGYSYDQDLLEKLPRVFPGVKVEKVDSTDLAESFVDITMSEREDVFEFVAVADVVLQPFKCRAEVKRFEPAELPALFLAGDDVQFMRSLEQSKEVSDEHWSAILTNLAESGRNETYATLCFNYENPLVRRMARIDDRQMVRLAVQMLYVQSLLLGHHPLNSKEMALLNTGLLDLIELGLDSQDGGGWVQ
jgi:molecular chaperone HtpG